ncbi:alpha/beta hydrolase [Paenibacillus tarimensis]
MFSRVKPDIADIQYGPYERNVLDLWLAKSKKPAPLLIWFHGGGFWYGDKSEGLPDLSLFLDRGISVAAPNYRLCPQFSFPAPMVDGGRAIQFLRYHSATWNINPEKVAVAGNSAGGHIAFWLAFHRDLANLASEDPIERQSTRIAAVGGEDAQPVFDPRELKRLFGHLKENFAVHFFGIAPQDLGTTNANRIYEEASPIRHVTKHSPPAFLIYRQGMDKITEEMDWQVLIHHPILGKCLKDRLDSMNIECELRYKADATGRSYEEHWAEMARFFSEKLF